MVPKGDKLNFQADAATKAETEQRNEGGKNNNNARRTGIENNIRADATSVARYGQTKILSGDLSMSEPGVTAVFATVKSAGLIAADAKFEMSRIVVSSYFTLSRIPK